MHRRDVVRMLEAAGFVCIHGGTHDKFVRGEAWVLVKRHSEIDDQTAKRILRQAGLR